MKDFLSGVNVIKKGANKWKDVNFSTKESSKKTSFNEEVEKILLDSKKKEDIIFYHYKKNNLIKLEFENNNISQYEFLEYDMDIEDDKIYLDEKEIENIKTYHVLNVLKPKVEIYLSYKDVEFNCTFMRNIYSYAEEIGFENTVGYLLPLIQDLNFQKVKGLNILRAFLDTFEKLLIYLRQYDTDHSIILKKILPVISQILTTKKDLSLLNRAVNALKFIIDNITMDECLNYILPILIEMGNSEDNEISQTLSIQIFSDKASYLGGEIIEVYVLPMFESFSENLSENLRLCCIEYMLPLFENINYNIIETKFIKIYTIFSKDKSFEIRKLSCRKLPEVCKIIINNNNNYNIKNNIPKEELIRIHLLNIFFGFTRDKRNDIQNCALGIFGEFISYLDNNIILSNPDLLNYYINKINISFDMLKMIKLDGTPLYNACYCLPSVLLTYCKKIEDEKEKKKNWEKLKPIFVKFIKSKEFKLKYCMACSFGEISSILNKKIVETEISPLIAEMFYANGYKIKSVIISVIPQHLLYVKEPKIRSQFLVIYKKGFNNIKNIKLYREKLKYLKGIKKMGDFFENYIIFDDLVGMLIEMCFDPYNIIRVKSVKILSLFLLKFLSLEKDKNENIKDNYNTENSECSSENEIIDYKHNSVVILNNFATCSHYHYRQLFIYLCKKILTNQKIFKEYAYELFKDLSYDKIVNVRFTLAIFMNKIWNSNKKEYGWIKKDEQMIEIIYRLKNDKEKDIKKLMKNIEIDSNKIKNKDKLLKSKYVNDYFVNEFKDFKKMFDFVPFLGKNWLNKK